MIKLTTLAGALLVLLGLLGASLWSTLPPVPVFADVVRQHPGTYLVVLDRHQQPLWAKNLSKTHRQLPWQTLETFSPELRTALLFNEDRRFLEHTGVDLRALAAAALAQTTGRSRGGSTLTMQLVRLLAQDTDLAGPMRRTVWGKLQQLAAAWRLESSWTKAQILEAYLNLAPLRGNVRGLHTGAAIWFAPPSTSAAAAETTAPTGSTRPPNQPAAIRPAWLLAMLPSPQAPLQQIGARACRLTQRQGLLPDCEALLAEPPQVGALNLGRQRLTPLTQQTRQHLASAGLKTAAVVPSSIDLKIQVATEFALAELLADLAGASARDAAAVVLDNRSGQVLAYVGSAGHQSTAPQFDGGRASRQPGSTIKPLLYAAAFDARRLRETDRLSTRPRPFPPRHRAEAAYRPRHEGPPAPPWVRPREALGGSINLPAVQVLQNLGVAPFVVTLDGLGLTRNGTVSAQQAGLALALGAHEVRLLDLTNAYRSLANGGLHGPVSWQRPVNDNTAADSQRVFGVAATAIVSSILADPGPRNRAFGEANVLNTPFLTMSKTGTSNGARDNWALGYSGRHTVGVWVGNFDNQAMSHVVGPNGAALAWRIIMQALHQLPVETATDANLPTPAPALLAPPSTPK